MADEDERDKATALLEWPDEAGDLSKQDKATRAAVAALGIEFDDNAIAEAWAARQEALASMAAEAASGIMADGQGEGPMGDAAE